MRCAIASLKGYCVGYIGGLLSPNPTKLNSSDRVILEENQTRLKSGISSREQDDFSISIDVSREAWMNDSQRKLFESGQKAAFDEYNKLCIDGARESAGVKSQSLSLLATPCIKKPCRLMEFFGEIDP